MYDVCTEILDNFDSYDSNGDDSLDAYEFSSFQSNYGLNSNKIFMVLDTDGSGKLEKSELETTLKLFSNQKNGWYERSSYNL